MNEELKQQTATETKINVRQKVLFVLAVIGLVGFGFAVAMIAQTTVPSEEPVTQPAVTYNFYAPTVDGLKTQMTAKATEMRLTKSQIDQAVLLIEDGTVDPSTTGFPWSNPFKCNSCNINQTGTCVYNGCLQGGCNFYGSNKGCHASWSYAF